MIEARTGLEALWIASEHAPYLALLDVQLPDINVSKPIEPEELAVVIASLTGLLNLDRME